MSKKIDYTKSPALAFISGAQETEQTTAAELPSSQDPSTEQAAPAAPKSTKRGSTKKVRPFIYTAKFHGKEPQGKQEHPTKHPGNIITLPKKQGHYRAFKRCLNSHTEQQKSDL